MTTLKILNFNALMHDLGLKFILWRVNYFNLETKQRVVVAISLCHGKSMRNPIQNLGIWLVPKQLFVLGVGNFRKQDSHVYKRSKPSQAELRSS